MGNVRILHLGEFDGVVPIGLKWVLSSTLASIGNLKLIIYIATITC